ncbi:MAG: hypothetical protein K8T91_16275 [Planctomycetes bacterium]|nr:hypothetical protein [Planctomycetota bacterium]
MAILTQFVLRLCFGLAAGMAITSPRQVTSGYFRNHLYVLLGFNVLAALVAVTSQGRLPLWPPVVAALLCYIGSVLWLYEKPQAGRVTLALIAAIDLAAAWLSGVLLPPSLAASGTAASSIEPGGLGITLLKWLDPPTGGLVLGLTIAAMFLGHWYLNTPSMELAPLRRLVRLSVVAVVLRGLLCAVGLAALWITDGAPDKTVISFLALRWLSGILGPLWLAWMTMRTLDIPNTQSATGILYVSVIATFTGELCSQLLSHGSRFPL